MKKIPVSAAWMVALACVSISINFFTPVWRIDLFAPQYPEGLVMKIWLNHLSGDVEVINGLNHYIGMAVIKEDMFPEFIYLPWITGVFIALGAFIVFTRNRKLLIGYFLLMITGGIVALYDFYQWGYKYGHELDPNAPIQVPGFSYQPPVLGYKKLLNFEAYSIPDIGGWAFVIAGGLVFLAIIWDRLQINKSRHTLSSATITNSAMLLLAMLLTACSQSPIPIAYGKDQCQFCKMILMDPKYGAEYVNTKGKVTVFDDLNCLSRYLKTEDIASEDPGIYVADYFQPNHLISATKAFFYQNPDFRTPMNSQTIATSGPLTGRDTQGAQKIQWQEVINNLAQ